MLKETPEVEDVVVTAETKALLGVPVKPKKKRYILSRSVYAKEDARVAKRLEARHSKASKKKAYKHLLRLADKLEGKGPYKHQGPISDRKFDLQNWINSTSVNRYPDQWVDSDGVVDMYSPYLMDETACGTTACAIGWAATDDYFKKLGVRFKGGTRVGVIDQFLAARSLGLEDERFTYFFFPTRYEKAGTPKLVANRIRHWLESSYFDGVRPE